MIGYFTGYIAKRQPIGRYELKLSTQNLPLMKTKLERWSPSHQLAQVVNRMYADLEAKGVLRSAPEEFNLAAHGDERDELRVEFIRAFRSTDFRGTFFSTA